MPRERMAPGEHGRITERSFSGKFYATTYVRDKDGKRRRVERSSIKSAEDARRLLQRHLSERRTPLTGQEITRRTTLSELFDLWIESKGAEDGVSPQTADQYRTIWAKHGERQLGSLTAAELATSRANAHLREMGATTQAKRLRMILRGMLSLAVGNDVIEVNPLREARVTRTSRKATRAASAEEFHQLRAAVRAYSDRQGPGPQPGKLLPAFVDLLAATGARPNEVLAIRWSEVAPEADPPTVTITGTLIDHGRIAGMPLHRQDIRKGGAPEHTVVLPQFGVDALQELLSMLDGHPSPSAPVLANRDGGWMSLANMRRSLRAALPEELSWITPHSLRRTVATVVRDKHGPALAQQQLSHAKLDTTEKHYLQRQTHGPDVRDALEEFAGQQPLK